MTDRIRQVTMEDLDRVTEVEAMCFPAAEAAGRQAFLERIQCFPDCFFVAEIGGEIVGFINGAATDSRVIVDEMFEDGSLHNPSGAYQSIFGLDVAPQWQHRGIAGELMRYMIEDARRRERRGLILTCKDRLIGFYEGFGYKSLGVSQSVHGGAVWYDMILEFSE